MIDDNTPRLDRAAKRVMQYEELPLFEKNNVRLVRQSKKETT